MVAGSSPFVRPKHRPKALSSKPADLQAVPLIINEFLASPPTGPSGDANGDGIRDSADDEFVEIVNTGATPLNVGGFSINDATAVRFIFPPNTVIPAGEAAVVFGGGHPLVFGRLHQRLARIMDDGIGGLLMRPGFIAPQIDPRVLVPVV